MNYSVTQGTNYVSLMATVSIIIKIVHEPGAVSPEEWQIVGLALVGFGVTLINWVNRYAKGDVALSGVKMY